MQRMIPGGLLTFFTAATATACSEPTQRGASAGDNSAVASADKAAARPAPAPPMNASVPPTPGAQPTELPFKPGWYAMGAGTAKCSKDEDIRDYAELRADRKTWDVSPAGAIKIVKITQTGPGAYRTTEVLQDEENNEDRHTVDYKQITPTSFTRQISKSNFWPDGTVAFQLCSPKDTPPNDL